MTSGEKEKSLYFVFKLLIYLLIKGIEEFRIISILYCEYDANYE